MLFVSGKSEWRAFDGIYKRWKAGLKEAEMKSMGRAKCVIGRWGFFDARLEEYETGDLRAPTGG